jgi:hypothetical protein
MVVVRQGEKHNDPLLFCGIKNLSKFQGIRRGETGYATIDHPDIRGLDTAR